MPTMSEAGSVAGRTRDAVTASTATDPTHAHTRPRCLVPCPAYAPTEYDATR